MKILGISGGNKNGANDCMCKEALLAAKEQGAEIEFVRLMDLDIKHCTGCKACVMSLFSGRGNMCVLKDDMRRGKVRTVSVRIAIPETSTLMEMQWQSAVSVVSAVN